MNALLQNLIALLLVTACVAYVGRQLFRTITAGKGKAGSCCGKGCASHAETPPTGSTQFISSDALRRARK